MFCTAPGKYPIFFFIHSCWHLALSLSVYITVASLRLFRDKVWCEIIFGPSKLIYSVSEKTLRTVAASCLFAAWSTPSVGHDIAISFSAVVPSPPDLFFFGGTCCGYNTKLKVQCYLIQCNQGEKKKQAITGTTSSTHYLYLSRMLLFLKRFEGF